MKNIFNKIQFSWKNLAFLALYNITLNFSFLLLYRQSQAIAWLFFLILSNILSSVVYYKMIHHYLPKNKILAFFTVLVLFSPFLALPLLLLLSLKDKTMASKSKFILVLCSSIAALTFSLTPQPFVTKKELLLCRLLPSEISYFILSAREAKNVSAITPFDMVYTPKSVKKIVTLRNEFKVEFKHPQTINPLQILNLMPLGFSWIRGAPIHAYSILEFYFIQH